jgi:hypothetical protein
MLALLWCGIGLCVVGCGGAIAVTVWVYRGGAPPSVNTENHKENHEDVDGGTVLGVDPDGRLVAGTEQQNPVERQGLRLHA